MTGIILTLMAILFFGAFGWLLKKIIDSEGRYLNSNHGYVGLLSELLLNIATGVNAHKVNYNIIEAEYKKHRK